MSSSSSTQPEPQRGDLVIVEHPYTTHVHKCLQRLSGASERFLIVDRNNVQLVVLYDAHESERQVRRVWHALHVLHTPVRVTTPVVTEESHQ